MGQDKASVRERGTEAALVDARLAWAASVRHDGPASSALALELLLQRGERAMLERLHGTLRLSENRRDLAVREVEHELQREDLLLLVRKVFDHLQQRLLADPVKRADLR